MIKSAYVGKQTLQKTSDHFFGGRVQSACMGPHTVKILIYVFLLNVYKRSLLFSSCFLAYVFSSTSVSGAFDWKDRCVVWSESIKTNYYNQAF